MSKTPRQSPLLINFVISRFLGTYQMGWIYFQHLSHCSLNLSCWTVFEKIRERNSQCSIFFHCFTWQDQYPVSHFLFPFHEQIYAPYSFSLLKVFLDNKRNSYCSLLEFKHCLCMIQ